jgi:hypothetical protein
MSNFYGNRQNALFVKETTQDYKFLGRFVTVIVL